MNAKRGGFSEATEMNYVLTALGIRFHKARFAHGL